MPNNTRTQADGFYVDGATLSPADWEDLERKIFGSWNGVRGGSYCTAGDRYVFGGVGIEITGPTRLTQGGSIYGGANAFYIRDNSWPELKSGHAGRTRSIVCPLESFLSPRKYLWSRYHRWGGVGSVALAARQSYGRTIETPELYAPLRVIDGATLTKVEVRFRVASSRQYAPLGMPKMRVMRVPIDPRSTDPVALRSTTDGFDGPALVTSGAAWYADGAAQSFTYVCDQNNVIDTSKYHYLFHLIEEVGALTPDDQFDGIRFVERKTDALRVVTNSNAMTGVVASQDGFNTSTGGRILVVDSDADIDAGIDSNNSAKNGLWIANDGGAWTRATDLDEQSDFSPGWIVAVPFGTINGGSLWQCQHPSLTSRITLSTGAADATSTRPRIVPAQPKGNIYHSLVPTFELSDLRFQ